MMMHKIKEQINLKGDFSGPLHAARSGQRQDHNSEEATVFFQFYQGHGHHEPC
jgi:hypothetical protein